MPYTSPSLLIQGAVDVPQRSLEFVRKQVQSLQAENESLKKRLAQSEGKLSLWMTAEAMVKSGTTSADPPANMPPLPYLVTQHPLPHDCQLADRRIATLNESLSSSNDTIAALRRRLKEAFDHGKRLAIENVTLKASVAKERSFIDLKLRNWRTKYEAHVGRLKLEGLDDYLEGFVRELEEIQDKTRSLRSGLR